MKLMSFFIILIALIPYNAHAGFAHFWEDGGTGAIIPFARDSVSTSGALGNFQLSGANCELTDLLGHLNTATGPAGLAICRMALKIRLSGGTCSVGANNIVICTGDIGLG